MSAVHEPVVGRYVQVAHGGYDYRVYYEEAGQGIPLVCLHTAGADSREYRHQLNDSDITSNFRVIAFDMPRHGKSIPPVGFETEDYRLTADFYSEFVIAFCETLELENPVVMGCSMGGNICLHLAANYEEKVRALIALEGCEYSPGWYISWLHHPHVHGGEACATSTFGLMAPQSPDEYRWETWWYYSQGGPGVFKGDLYFYSVDHDFRGKTDSITGNIPIYFLTGVYDFACTPEMTQETAEKVKGSECIIMEGIGHFPTSENPETFKQYLMPVLEKVQAAKPESAKASGKTSSKQ